MRAEALTGRSISIGGDVIQSILITGDHNRVFVGDYERLRDAYIPPWSVFERVRLDRFVGREWLVAEVDAFLRDHDRGLFVLEAAAGLGKTTFLAHLVKTRGYIHHFVELAPGDGGIAPGLRNLAAQLVRAWELNLYHAEGVLPGAAARPHFLQKLLFEAARKRDEIRPGEKIVLVVDGLDEAGTPPGQNVLGLPRVLPQGVYLIVSQRPVAVTLRVEGPRRVFRLEAQSEENRADMRAYLEAAATWSGVARALAEQGYAREQFVAALLEKCRGVWIYLHYVVGEIERGERSPLDLATLPEDVWQYYAQYWSRWRDDPRWYTDDLPLLSTLAAAQEALPFPRLCTLAGVEARPDLERLLREAWRPFLAVEGATEGRRYRLYHASLREFLDGRADLERLEETERSLAEELAAATQQAHARIADRYLAAWSGLEAGLPGLREPGKRDLDGGYGLRHLAAHLAGAGRGEDLHRLLRVEWVHEEGVPYTRPGLKGWLDRLLGRKRTCLRRRYENAWYATKEAVGDTDGFLTDVARAWRLAEEPLTPPPAAGTAAPSPLPPGGRGEGARGRGEGIALQCRYAFITASLNALAKNIPPALLAALVAKGVWTPAQGLAYARQVPDAGQRAEALMALAPHLPEGLLAQALAAAGEIRDGALRTEALRGLAPHLPEALLAEALAAAREIRDPEARAWALAGLAHHLAELGHPHEALAAAGEIRDGALRTKALRKVAPHLPAELRKQALREALAAAREIEREDYRAEVLAGLAHHLAELGHPHEALAAAGEIRDGALRTKALRELAPHLPAELRKQALREALAAAREIRDADDRARALTGLAPHLPEDRRQEVLAEALAATGEIGDGALRTKALRELAPHLPAELRKQALREALAAAREIEREDRRAEVLAGLAHHLAELGHPHEALAAAGEIRDGALRTEALRGLASYLPAGLRKQALREALAAAREVRDADDRAKALAGLAPHLPEALLAEALAAAREIRDPEARAWALAGLAPRLAELGHPEEALAAAREIGWKSVRARALAGLAPRLAELGHPEEALAAAGKIWDEALRAKALRELAPHLPEELRKQALREALAAARKVRYADDRAEALAGLAPRLAELGHPEEALAAAREIGNAKHRARALAGLAPHLPEALLAEALAAAREIEREDRRAEALAGLAPHLARLPREQLSPLWRETLHILAARTRQDLLADLRALGPVVAALGGAEAVAGTFRAIQDVGRWWP